MQTQTQSKFAAVKTEIAVGIAGTIVGSVLGVLEPHISDLIWPSDNRSPSSSITETQSPEKTRSSSKRRSKHSLPSNSTVAVTTRVREAKKPQVSTSPVSKCSGLSCNGWGQR